MDEKAPFLSRWSRRKLAAKRDAPTVAAPAAESRGADAATPPAPAAEPSPAPGTPGYREFFDPQVDEQLRRSALKQLFNEPQFNVMDGLDTYIDDYAKPDPIPDAMLRRLNQAKDLFLFDGEGRDGASDAGAAAAGRAAPVAPADAAALPQPAANAPDRPADAAADTAPAAPADAAKK